ncbi:MAG: cation-translocating P-type ATPase [Dehalococcoidia bacterium]
MGGDGGAPTSTPVVPDEPWALAAGVVLERLVTPAGGLARAERERRRERYGWNEVRVASGVSAFGVFVRQFQSPLIYILLAALALTLVLREYVDSLAIALVLTVNAVVGFLQEYRAERAMAALQRLSPPRAVRLSGGRRALVDARELVPGDLVLVEAGTRVPADLRLVEAAALEVDESLLTGESVPVGKAEDAVARDSPVADRASMLFAGTTVTRGRAQGVVTATGHGTQLGAIASALGRTTAVETPLQRRVTRLARQIALGVGLMGCVGLLAGLLHGGAVAELLLTISALAVSAVPEGLPIVLTVTLAIGVRRMASQGAVVRQLPAAETLGSCTVIGTDKTGTLTENHMTVVELFAGGETYEARGVGYDTGDVRGARGPVNLSEHETLRWVLTGASLCNDARITRGAEGFVPSGDPTEVALLVVAAKAGLERPSLAERWPRIAERPFDPGVAFAATYHREGVHTRIFVKGAPERVLRMCSRDACDRALDTARILARADAFAARGRRVLALATAVRRDAPRDPATAIPSQLEFLGLVAMIDPPRASAIAAVSDCQRAGIRVLMITGDHAATAVAIAGQVGIAHGDVPPLTGPELDRLSDQQLVDRLRETSVCARAAPEHKLRIVRALQRDGHVVAVTGDGANDAPALSAADIGVAMGASGTDVAREASDIVLTDDNFASIFAAVREGRVAFANLRKATLYLLATALAEVAVVLVTLFLGTRIVFLPAQLLWMNVVTEGVTDVAMAFEPPERDVARRAPHPPQEQIMAQPHWERAAVAAVFMTATVLTFFFIDLQRGATDEHARSVAMAALVTMQALFIGSVRSEREPIWRISPLRNRFLLAAASGGLLLQWFVMQWGPTQRLFRVTALDLQTWIAVISAACALLLLVELHKLWRRSHDPAQGD